MRLITSNDDLRKTLMTCSEYDRHFLAVCGVKDLFEESFLQPEKIAFLYTESFAAQYAHHYKKKYRKPMVEVRYLKALTSCEGLKLVNWSRGRFHPKIYLFTKDNETKWACVIGSFNLNKKGIKEQVQTSVYLTNEDDSDGRILQSIKQLFQNAFHIESKHIIASETYLEEISRINARNAERKAKREDEKKSQNEQQKTRITCFNASLSDSSFNRDIYREILEYEKLRINTEYENVSSYYRIRWESDNIRTKEAFDALVEIMGEREIPIKTGVVILALMDDGFYPLLIPGRSYPLISLSMVQTYSDYWDIVQRVGQVGDRFFSREMLQHKASVLGLCSIKTFSAMYEKGVASTISSVLEFNTLNGFVKGRGLSVLKRYFADNMSLEQIGEQDYNTLAI